MKLKNYFFDFSSLDQFWKIAAVLEKDQPPTSEQWDALFNTPAYAVLIQEESPYRSKRFFKVNFQLAFMPSNKEKLKHAMKKKNARYLKHYVMVQEEKSKIKEAIRKLKKDSASIMRKSLIKALDFLPMKMKKIHSYPPVSFLVFDKDARGYSPILVDIIAYIEWGKNLLAHEIHHYIRNEILCFDFESITREDRDIMWTLNQIQAEGIADQVYQIQDSDNMSYKRMCEKTVPQILKQIDKFLCKIMDFPKAKKDTGIKLKEINPRAGHPTGFYMTNIILDQLGKELLVKSVGNPFEFFHLYNKAAKARRGNTPSFSEKAMRVLSGLEKKYILK